MAAAIPKTPGQTGLLIERSDVPGLTEAVIWLCDDTRLREEGTSWKRAAHGLACYDRPRDAGGRGRPAHLRHRHPSRLHGG